MDKNSGPKFLLDTLLKVVYGVILVCVTFVLSWAFDYIRNGDMYAFIGIGYVVFYLLFVPALVMLISGRAVSRALRLVGLAWVPLVILVVTVLAYGFLKDASGAHCVGFFSAPTSCASNQFLLVLLLFFNPYSILVWMGLSIVGLAKGWHDYFGNRRGMR